MKAARAAPHLQHWPAGVPLQAPVPRTTLPQCLADSAARWPGKPAIIFAGSVLSYADLKRRSDALAAHLRQAGVAPGDRVLLMAQNSPQWVLAFYALLRAGAVVVPVNPMSKATEVAYFALDSGARLALVSQELLAQLPLSEAAGPLTAGLVMEHLEGLLDTVAATPGPLPTDPDALAVLPYTSGTTGKPKACRHSHATLLASLAASALWKQLNSDSVVLTVAPLFHMLGLQNGMNLPLLLGATAVMMPRWHAATAARLMEAHHITAWSAPPAMVIDLFADPATAGRDLSSLRLLSGGGAAMPEAVAAMLLQRFGLTYQEAYGLTETASFLHANPPARCKRQCLGVPTQGVDSRIVDPETGAELAAGEVGELVTHAPQVMLGYWHNPAADEAAFITIDGKRFFRTGDLALMDDDGYFFLKDRLKRMINVSGYKVWPAEVENALYAHPAVLEACVIAVPDARAGDAVKAVVVLKPGHEGSVTEAGFISWCRAQMAVYKAPRRVDFVAALPKSGTGKILWRELQEAHHAALTRKGTTEQPPTTKASP